MRINNLPIFIFLWLSISLKINAKEKKIEKENLEEAAERIYFQEYENKDKPRYLQKIISGSAATIIGNLGYFNSDAYTLKLAYSGVQAIGVFNIGSGIKEYYEKDLNKLNKSFAKKIKTKKTSKKNKLLSANDFYIHNLKAKAIKKRAKRNSILATTSILTLQYLTNIYVGKPEESLKNIFYFLAGTNVVIFSYNYYFESEEEKLIFGLNQNFSPNGQINFYPALTYNF
ncbi:hypothetical protein N9N67_00565 [Bacteriovoracaceae bacterium]|nr:hypothetical protein [Bacteriovoracaceae bacterium]